MSGAVRRRMCAVVGYVWPSSRIQDREKVRRDCGHDAWATIGATKARCTACEVAR